MIDEEKLSMIALTMVPKIGGVLGRQLISYFGSAQAVLEARQHQLERIPLIGKERAEQIRQTDWRKIAERELKFIKEHGIVVRVITDEDFPRRLKILQDSPLVLYTKGKMALDQEKTLGIVGTRKASNYGKDLTRKLVYDLKDQQPLIVSGMAYGIDIAAHKAAVDFQLPTVGILGHNLQSIYPAAHFGTAQKMLEHGGLISEYFSGAEMSPHNFPQRNRIIAGLSDALLLVESGETGGAVITAHIMHSYNKDIFAIPGRVGDKQSAGCNRLIKNNMAMLVESAEDIIKALRWDETNKLQPMQLRMALDAPGGELANFMKQRNDWHIDELAHAMGYDSPRLAADLLELEMNGWVVGLPGKRYKLVT